GPNIGEVVPASPTVLTRGDVGQDGHVNDADISALMDALANLNAYQSGHSWDAADLADIADLNGDGLVTNDDIQTLIDFLANGGGSGSLTSVPEPRTSVLVLLGLLAIGGVQVHRLRVHLV